MCDQTFYEQRLRDMLRIAGIPVKPVYLPAEVQQILNIRDYTLRQMCSRWEPPGTVGRPTGEKAGLESYVINTHRRVPFHGLVNWLSENSTYERERAL